MGEVKLTKGPAFRPCDLCEEAWHGLIRQKIELEERLEQTRRNHDSAMRLYSEWRSRAGKAEAELEAKKTGLSALQVQEGDRG